MTSMASSGQSATYIAGLQSLSRAADRIQRDPGYTQRTALEPAKLIELVGQLLPEYPDRWYQLMAAAADSELIARLGQPVALPGAITSLPPRHEAVLAVAARLYYLAAPQAMHGDSGDPEGRISWFLGRGLRDPELLPPPDGPIVSNVRQGIVDYWAYPDTGELFVVYSDGDPVFCEELVLRLGDPGYSTAARLYAWRVGYEIRQSAKRRQLAIKRSCESAQCCAVRPNLTLVSEQTVA